MRITVAVASYNHERYAAEALDSVASQAHADIELIWIDDHSKDETFEIIERTLRSRAMSKRFSRVFLHRNAINRGAHYTLNLAARLGTGELISFLNSDDTYMPARLRRFAETYRGEDHWIGFSGVLAIGPEGTTVTDDYTAQEMMITFPEILERFETVSKALLYRNVVSSTGNIVISRKLFDRLGGFQNLAFCHDWLLALCACLYCEPAYLPETLYAYRLHTTNSFRSLGHVAEHETSEVLRTFFREVALNRPTNQLLATFRNRPVEFYAFLDQVGLADTFQRVLHPYAEHSRMIDLV